MNLKEELNAVYNKVVFDREQKYKTSPEVVQQEDNFKASVNNNMEKYRQMASNGYRKAIAYETNGDSCMHLKQAIQNLTFSTFGGNYKGLSVYFTQKNGTVFKKHECNVEIVWREEGKYE